MLVLKNKILPTALICSTILLSGQSWAKTEAKPLSLEDIMDSLYTNVFIKNAKNASQQCVTTLENVKKLTPASSVSERQNVLKPLITNWKKVQANYVIADFEVDSIDIPAYIDIYHTTNEDIKKQINRAVKSNSSIENTLFKNSYKTINALESLLLANNEFSERERDLSVIATNNICKNLTEISQIYTASEKDFTENPEKSLAVIINNLIDSAFKLKDWRLGEPTGLSKKYQDKPDANRAEYHVSHLSLDAIGAILAAHQQIIGEQKYANLTQIAPIFNSEKVQKKSRAYLTQVLSEYNKLKTNNPNFNFDPKQTKPLYDAVSNLYKNYYADLLSSLPIVGVILEADGD